MSKLKTKKGVAKRFRLSGKGKVKYFAGGKSHLATSKKSKKLRDLRRRRVLGTQKETKFLKRLLPYG